MPGRPRPVPRVIAATALAGAIALLAACSGSGSTPKASSSPSAPAATGSATSSPTTSPSSTPSPPSPAHVRADARAKVRAIITKAPKHGVSVAALDLKTGVDWSAGATSGMWTASVYKLFVLETLMLQNHGALGGGEADGAVPMIENSDNVEGYALWEDAGGNSGLAAAAKRFGMTHTQAIGTDPTFTRTSAPDLLKLAHNLVVPGGPLTAAAKHQALYLMRNVESDQRWGVGVVADKGTTFYNKNGWLGIDDSNPAGEDDDGRWAVNSVGIVTVHGHRLLMAVMTQHDPDFQSGVNLTEKLARRLAPAVTGIPG